MIGLVGRVVSFDYTNWRGERGNRTVVVSNIYWGSNEWHPEEQWLLAAYDLVKGQRRFFALKDIRDIAIAGEF